MGQLLFNCPITKQRAPTGVETDAQSLRASWSARIKLSCNRRCGGLHELAVRETYIDVVLEDSLALRRSIFRMVPARCRCDRPAAG
jgi:hypothetical protein